MLPGGVLGVGERERVSHVLFPGFPLDLAEHYSKTSNNSLTAVKRKKSIDFKKDDKHHKMLQRVSKTQSWPQVTRCLCNACTLHSSTSDGSLRTESSEEYFNNTANERKSF